MSDTRLIERWLPISEIGIESTRERTPMTPFPAPNRLHVWWARRPLIASRAAVLASLLPADADRQKFLHMLGIHGDPVAARRRIVEADRNGERLGAHAYGYPRAFGYAPSDEDQDWLTANSSSGTTVLDPTAGGGSVPFEALRLGFTTNANDLNPVAVLIELATLAWPAKHGFAVRNAVEEIGDGLQAYSRKNRETIRGPMVISGRVRSVVLTATGWCRCRRTGAWRQVEPGSGSNISGQYEPWLRVRAQCGGGSW